MLVWFGSVLPTVAVPAFLYADEPGSQINIRSAPTTRSSAPRYGIPGDKVEKLREVKGKDGYTWYYVRLISHVLKVGFAVILFVLHLTLHQIKNLHDLLMGLTMKDLPINI